MKFIRITEHTEEFHKSKPENFDVLLKKHVLWLEEKKKEGKLLDAYLMAGSDNCSLFIWDFETAEEIDKIKWEDPIGFTFKDPKVYPAVDVFEHIKHVMLH